jgi:hypothetical protein
MMRDGGKGDMQRPLGVEIEQFDNNWDAIFKRKKNELHDISSGRIESDSMVRDNGRADIQHVEKPSRRIP